MRGAGFTLVEMIVTILVVGILAVVVLPRFVDRSDFDTLKFYDQALAAVRYAHKVAIAQRRTVVVIANATSLSACFSPCNAGDSVTDPGTGNPLAITAPSGVTLSASAGSFSFNGLGQTSAAVTVTILGSPTRSFTVEQETGFVHP